eukprot:9471772-Pyramimonas_sp.AAC.2
MSRMTRSIACIAASSPPPLRRTNSSALIQMNSDTRSPVLYSTVMPTVVGGSVRINIDFSTVLS